MTFAQFYDVAVWPAHSKELIEVCGDRGTIHLDGRESLKSLIEICEKYADECNYKAYKIFKGETINRDTKELYSNCKGG